MLARQSVPRWARAPRGRQKKGPLAPRARPLHNVPNLQLDRLAVQVDRADLEVDTNRRDVALRVRVVRKTEKKARLAHSRIADQQKLEQIVAARGTRAHTVSTCARHARSRRSSRGEKAMHAHAGRRAPPRAWTRPWKKTGRRHRDRTAPPARPTRRSAPARAQTRALLLRCARARATARLPARGGHARTPLRRAEEGRVAIQSRLPPSGLPRGPVPPAPRTPPRAAPRTQHPAAGTYYSGLFITRETATAKCPATGDFSLIIALELAPGR